MFRVGSYKWSSIASAFSAVVYDGITKLLMWHVSHVRTFSYDCTRADSPIVSHVIEQNVSCDCNRSGDD